MENEELLDAIGAVGYIYFLAALYLIGGWGILTTPLLAISALALINSTVTQQNYKHRQGELRNSGEPVSGRLFSTEAIISIAISFVLTSISLLTLRMS